MDRFDGNNGNRRTSFKPSLSCPKSSVSFGNDASVGTNAAPWSSKTRFPVPSDGGDVSVTSGVPRLGTGGSPTPGGGGGCSTKGTKAVVINRERKFQKMVKDASAEVVAESATMPITSSTDDTEPTMPATPSSVVVGSTAGRPVMDPRALYVKEARAIRERLDVIDLARMEKDLLYKLFFTKDVEFKRRHLFWLADIVDWEYRCLGADGMEVGAFIRMKADPSRRPDMAVWNTLILAGLYLEHKFIAYFMPHVVDEVCPENSNGGSGLMPAAKRARLMPSIRALGMLRKGTGDPAQGNPTPAPPKRRKVGASVAAVTSSYGQGNDSSPPLPPLTGLEPDPTAPPKRVNERKFAGFVNNHLKELFESFLNNDSPGAGGVVGFTNKSITTYMII